MTAAEAEAYHAVQIGAFRDTQADMVTAMTLNYAEEAIGITRAAVQAGMPVAISFTLETDGRLPTGQTLQPALRGANIRWFGASAAMMTRRRRELLLSLVINLSRPLPDPTGRPIISENSSALRGASFWTLSEEQVLEDC